MISSRTSCATLPISAYPVTPEISRETSNYVPLQSSKESGFESDSIYLSPSTPNISERPTIRHHTDKIQSKAPPLQSIPIASFAETRPYHLGDARALVEYARNDDGAIATYLGRIGDFTNATKQHRVVAGERQVRHRDAHDLLP